MGIQPGRPGRALWEELPGVLQQQQQPFWGSERGGPNSGPGFSVVFVEAVSVMRNRNQLRLPQYYLLGGISWSPPSAGPGEGLRSGASETCQSLLSPTCASAFPPNRHLCFYVLMADDGHPIPREHQASLGGRRGAEDPSLPALVTCTLFHPLPPPIASAVGPSFPVGFDALSPPP